MGIEGHGRGLPAISCSKILWSVPVPTIYLRVLAVISVWRCLAEPLPEVEACGKAVDDLSFRKDRNVLTVGI